MSFSKFIQASVFSVIVGAGSAIVGTVATTTSADAATIRACTNANQIVNVAIAYPTDVETFTMAGWWRIPSNGCIDLPATPRNETHSEPGLRLANRHGAAVLPEQSEIHISGLERLPCLPTKFRTTVLLADESGRRRDQCRVQLLTQAAVSTWADHNLFRRFAPLGKVWTADLALRGWS